MKTCVTSTDRRQHLRALDSLSFREADCDIDHCLVVAKVRERLAEKKQRKNFMYRGSVSRK
jgi:hypothetical protein